MSSPLDPPADDAVTGRRRRWPLTLSVIVVVICLAVVVASRINLSYYAIQPGSAQPVAPLVHVPAGKQHTVTGSVLLTDVSLGPVTLLNVIPYLLSSDTDLVKSSSVLGPDTTAAELTDQGYLEMAQSQAAAKSLGLTTLGYHVASHDDGALVFAVAPDAPAARALQVAQIIKAVDGQTTPNSCAFVRVVHDLPPGTPVHLSVEQSTVTPQAVVKPGPVVERTVVLGRPPRGGLTATACPGVSGPSRGYLGISVTTWTDDTYPFPVSIDTSDIGGPSAGLAMTLGVIDKLSTGDVTGHHVVAATGTIDTTGAVGDVSGVPQKTVAVEHAGATVFLVPPQELAAARSKATPQLHVYAVSSLSDALAVLRRIGGSVPRAPGTGGRGTPTNGTPGPPTTEPTR